MSQRGRSDRGENNDDGSTYEVLTKLQCIQSFRNNSSIVEYEIGKGESELYGALDDVVCTVTLNDRRTLTYAMQAKQSGNNDQISSDSLWKNVKNKNYNVAKYFQSYLNMKQHVPSSQIKEMIIWTTQAIANSAKDFFVEYRPDPTDDILGSVIGATVHRWKINRSKLENSSYGNLLYNLVDEAHPLSDLVNKFVTVIADKKTWSSKGAAKDCYRMMAKEVIDCDKKEFQPAFIEGASSLHADTQIFRRIFQCAMKRKNENFSMDLLNNDDYKPPQIDNNFTKGSGKPSWNIKGHVSSQDDVEEFIERFIFYTNVPKVAEFREVLTKLLGARFGPLYDLIKPCTFKRMSCKSEIEAIYKLIELRNAVDFKPDHRLKFDDNGVRIWDLPEKHVFVEVTQDVDVSVNRILTAKEFVQPYLGFRFRSLQRRMPALIAVTEQAKVCEHGLGCIVIGSIDAASVKVLLNQLRTFTGKIIFVGEKWADQQNLEIALYKDEFDVGQLTSECTSYINSKEVEVFGNFAAVDQVFPSNFIRKENFKLILKLYRLHASDSISFGENELLLEEHFDSRLKNLNDYFGSPVVISDQAGMGKTTEMFRIAEKIRQQHLNCLAVYLECNAAVGLFRDEKSNNSIEKVVNVVCKVIKADQEYQKLMVEEMFRSGSVVLLLDGYDEVSDKSQKDLEQLIAACSKANLRGLCIATRPHCTEMIKKVLGVARTYDLSPFTEQEQLEYLRKAWKTAAMTPDKRTRVEAYAKDLLKTFQTVFGQKALLGIPLQMKMIATIYSEQIHEDSDEFELPKFFQIGSIVEKFVQRKLDLAIGKSPSDGRVQEIAFESMRREFPLHHVTMAYSIFRNITSTDIEQLFAQNAAYDLVRLKPTVAFSHETYLSYFLALYFLTYHTKPNEFKQYMKRYLCPNRVDVATKFMDFHIGRITHQPLLGTQELSSDFAVPATALLHQDKIREFNHYLNSSCTETEVFTLIRNSLNAAAFNVLEVLYDSLDESCRNKVQFRFGGGDGKQQTQNRHLVNLKRLGKEQTLAVLKLLFRKNPTAFVRDWLTNFRDGEEDFIEVTCRKPFPDVLEWLFEQVPELNQDELNALVEYLERRIKGYVKILVQHNNAAMIGRIIEWVRTSSDKAVLKVWLENHDLLEEFALNVEQKADNKEFLLESRIEMVEMVHDFYKWIYGNNVLLTEKILNVIQMLDKDGIKNAFMECFNNNQ